MRRSNHHVTEDLRSTDEQMAERDDTNIFHVSCSYQIEDQQMRDVLEKQIATVIDGQCIIFRLVIVGLAIVESSLDSTLRHRPIDGHVVFDLNRKEQQRISEASIRGVSLTHSLDMFIRLMVACFTRNDSSMLEKISG